MTTNEHFSLKLTDLIDPAELDELNRQFARTFNVASAIIDPEGNYLIKPYNICPVCRLIRRTEKGRDACQKSEVYITQWAAKLRGPEITPCRNIGFAEAAAPIYVAGHHLATWLVGQFSPLDVTPEKISRLADKIGADRDELLQAFSIMKKREDSECKEGIKLLWKFATKLSQTAYAKYKLKEDIAE